MLSDTHLWVTEALRKLDADAAGTAIGAVAGTAVGTVAGPTAGTAAGTTAGTAVAPTVGTAFGAPVDTATAADSAIAAGDVAVLPETPLRVFPLPASWGIDLYLKDESVHPTGSLKHRLAHSLLTFALVNGDLDQNTTLVEASSGSTAVSEAYFAQLLGLDFVAVVPATTSPSKLALIEQYGGTCLLIADPNDVYAEAERLGARDGWFYLDQFTNASVVTDWRRNNIGSAIFDQLAGERFPEPRWIVVGAGTGGTSATIGRHCQYRKAGTRVVVVDPEGSVFARAWAERCRDITGTASRIEGIGRPRVEPSFIPAVIDEVMEVPDAGSIAAMRLLADVMGIQAGGSTGTNLYGSFQLIERMLAAGETGSIVTLICDGGDRYLDSYYSDEWVTARGFDLAHPTAQLRAFLASGTFSAAE